MVVKRSFIRFCGENVKGKVEWPSPFLGITIIGMDLIEIR